MDSLLLRDDVHRASRLLDESTDDAHRLDVDALRGRLVEFTAGRGHPQVTLAVERLADVHRAGEPAAWIGPSTSLFYPPDATDFALDWSALALIQIEDVHRAAMAADKLLRSGAFGLVVLDLIEANDATIPSPLAGRLLRLAETHDSAAVFLTDTARATASLSSLIALRARVEWTDVGTGRMAMNCTVLRDKHRGPGERIEEVYDGALGLR